MKICLPREIAKRYLMGGHLDFDIVSDLDIRISDFRLPDATLGYDLCNTQYAIRNTRQLPSTSVENALQISYLFMQNEPNFRKSQMNINKALTKDYEEKTLGEHGKNEPKTNPIKANSKPIKANLKPKRTQYEPKQTQFQRQKNVSGGPKIFDNY